MPWRHMGEWRYSSTILDLGIRWMWVVSVTPRPLYSRGGVTGTRWIGGWVDPRVGLDAVDKRKILPLPGSKLWSSSPYSVTIPTELFQLLSYWRNRVGLSWLLRIGFLRDGSRNFLYGQNVWDLVAISVHNGVLIYTYPRPGPTPPPDVKQ
jgi:hypothetical protein